MYSVLLFADSLVQIGYESDTGQVWADVPDDVFDSITRIDSVIKSQKGIPPRGITEAMVDARQGIFRLHIFREFSLWLALAFLLSVFGLVIGWPRQEALPIN